MQFYHFRWQWTVQNYEPNFEKIYGLGIVPQSVHTVYLICEWQIMVVTLPLENSVLISEYIKHLQILNTGT